MPSTANAMEYPTTYFPGGGTSHRRTDRGGRGAIPGMSLKTLAMVINRYVG
jgi:hypothetical protein